MLKILLEAVCLAVAVAGVALMSVPVALICAGCAGVVVIEVRG